MIKNPVRKEVKMRKIRVFSEQSSGDEVVISIHVHDEKGDDTLHVIFEDWELGFVRNSHGALIHVLTAKHGKCRCKLESFDPHPTLVDFARKIVEIVNNTIPPLTPRYFKPTTKQSEHSLFEPRFST